MVTEAPLSSLLVLPRWHKRGSSSCRGQAPCCMMDGRSTLPSRLRCAPRLVSAPLHSHERVLSQVVWQQSQWQDGSLGSCVACSSGDRRGRLKSAKIKSGLLPEFGVCSDLCRAVCPWHDSQLVGSLDGGPPGVLGRGRDATTAPGAVLESGGCGPVSMVFNVDLGAPPSATPHF